MTTPDPHRSTYGWPPAARMAEAADEVLRYEVEDMTDFVGHLGQLPAMAGNFELAIRRLARKTEEELPAATAVVQLLDAMADTLKAVEHAAEEVRPGARRAHQADLERSENPRRNEHLWNVRGPGRRGDR